MSIVHSDGAKWDFRPRQQLIDGLLGYRGLIGDRRSGMAQLYFRAGLSHRQIAAVFGIRRQMVTYELGCARRLVLDHLSGKGRQLKPTRRSE